MEIGLESEIGPRDRNRVRVQVNITNPADPTFWARDLIPWVGFPDALIRDHRKISFFDVDSAVSSHGTDYTTAPAPREWGIRGKNRVGAQPTVSFRVGQRKLKSFFGPILTTW